MTQQGKINYIDIKMVVLKARQPAEWTEAAADWHYLRSNGIEIETEMIDELYTAVGGK